MAALVAVESGALLACLTLLCALSALAPLLVKPILACICRPSPEEQLVWSKIIKLKAEQRSISMKDEFAAYSKIQRQIIKLETELKDVSQSRTSKNIAIKGMLKIGLQAIVGFMMLCSVYWFRYEPLVLLKGDLTPFSKLLSYPTSVPNSISAHVWVIISNYSIRALIKPLTT